MLSNSLYFTWGGPWALASALYWARCFGPCVVGGCGPLKPSIALTSGRSSASQTAELPRNHYNSPSGFDPALRCYTPQGRTSRDGRLRSYGHRIILHLAFLFTFFPIDSNPHVLPVGASRTIVQSRVIFVRRRADNHKLGGSPTRGAPQTKTSSCHSFVLTHISRCFSSDWHAGHRALLMGSCSDHLLPDGPSQAGSM